MASEGRAGEGVGSGVAAIRGVRSVVEGGRRAGEAEKVREEQREGGGAGGEQGCDRKG